MAATSPAAVLSSFWSLTVPGRFPVTRRFTVHTDYTIAIVKATMLVGGGDGGEVRSDYQLHGYWHPDSTA